MSERPVPPSARRRLRDVLSGRSVDDLELGVGVWRRDHDRFRRAVDRYHQVMEPVADGVARDRLEVAGGRLAACLDAVRGRCVEAQLTHPSLSLVVPSGAIDQHHRLSRAATLAAQAAEAATMVRVAARAMSGDGTDSTDVVGQRCDAVDRAVALVKRDLSG